MPNPSLQYISSLIIRANYESNPDKRATQLQLAASLLDEVLRAEVTS